MAAEDVMEGNESGIEKPKREGGGKKSGGAVETREKGLHWEQRKE